MYKVELSESEILLLDGRVSTKVQEEVDKAKLASSTGNNLTEDQRKLVAEIVAVARKEGKLTRVSRLVKSCPGCKKSLGYYPHNRGSRYHKKGSPDYNKPKTFLAWDYNRGFIGVDGYVSLGCCLDCASLIEPVLFSLLKDIPAELPDVLASVKYKKYENKVCTNCKWEGHEGQLGNLPTLMGDGYYRGQCPKCGVKNNLFSLIIKSREGFFLEKI